MFELNDTILERVIFAMEDQSKAYLVDCDSGDLVQKSGVQQLGPGAMDRLVEPPAWTSNDGFKLMELFASSVRNPELKTELSQALSRGKRVFKTFKEILGTRPDTEKAFSDFKLRHMRIKVQGWLNDIREANGLSRLPEEPEETDDLLLTDFSVFFASIADTPFDVHSLLDKACLESQNAIPQALISMEKEALAAFLRQNVSTAVCAWVDDEHNIPVGVIVGAIESVAGRALALIRFLHVDQSYRNLGIGTMLLEQLISHFKGKGISSIYLESLFLPFEYETSLTASGFSPTGVHCLFRAE